MDLHSLSNTKGAKSSRIRKGRGLGSKGKTCGKGHKGQMARKGNKHKLGFEGGQMPLIRRLPKRGFTNPVRKELLPVNVCDLALFEDGAEVTMLAIRENGLANGVADGIKILGPRFGIKTVVGFVSTSLWITLLENLWGYEALVDNAPLLSSIYGGALIGVGLGMVFKAKATSGGTDIIAMIINKYRNVSLPANYPAYGKTGPLMQRWR